ncbi:MAG: lipopolysaccharide heptosyltransferase II [Acidithiobacillus sp.]
MSRFAKREPNPAPAALAADEDGEERGYSAFRNTRLARSNDPAQLLLIGPSWVGDMVMAQVLLQVLRRRWPRLQIDLLAPAPAATLGERMPEVRQVYVTTIQHGRLALRERRAWAQRLRSVDYDWSICLPNSLKAALIPYWARIPVRTGFRGEGRLLLLNDRRTLDRRKLVRTVDRYVALGIPRRLPQPSRLPAPRLRVDVAAREHALERLGLVAPDGPVLALAPGAEYGPAKRWPLRHWIALAQEALHRGYAVWALGGPKDASLTAEISAAVPAVVDLGGKTSLVEATDLLSLATTTVSNDSGLMHIAGAVGSHVIALYGSSPLAMTPPLGPEAVALRLDLPCSPCGKRRCPLKHHRCMEDLGVERVLPYLGATERHVLP